MTARIIDLPDKQPGKIGFRKARRKKRPDLEDFGQLNLFSQPDEARIISLYEETHSFEQALLLEEEGDLEGAVKLYEKAIRRDDHLADSYCNMGIISSERGNLPEALNYFTLALVSEPRHLEAHYNLANLYADAGNTALAKLHYEVAIQIDPSFASAYYNIAVVLLEREEWRDAEERLMQFRSIANESDKTAALSLLNHIRNQLKTTNYDE